MATSWSDWYWHLGLASLLAMGRVFIAASGDCVKAQITPDGTLGAESSVVTPTNIDGIPTEQIDGGATRGANLFHSFEKFSIPIGSAAYFNNAQDIQNIISRVTGSSISNIDGLLRAKESANLFLLNPNGIIFGPNASLNIGGSFVGSTASAVNFADGTQFSATAPPPTPLLRVSVPLGLQFGGTTPGSIRNQSQATNSSGVRVGLAVQPGKTLALIGGNVRLEGGQLQAPGGRVELGGASGAGMVGLRVDGNNLSLSFPDAVERTDISLIKETYGARVDVTANGGGSIALNARNLEILEGSTLSAGIGKDPGSVGSQAGDITLNATGVITVAGAGGGIFNGVQAEAVGKSGDINITTGSLFVTNGARLLASTNGQGDAGNVNIHAGSTVSFNGVDSDGRSSGASSGVGASGWGNGGSVNITAESLSVTNGAQVVASTRNKGNAGNLNIHATRTVSLDGVGWDGARSAARSNVEGGADGNGGGVNITAESLSVSNGAEVGANTYGRGNAGSVNIYARDTVSFNGGAARTNNVTSRAVGNGGGINITTKLLSVTNGGQLSADSAGNGAAGNIEVTARSIRLDNQALLSSNTRGGQGNINLRSRGLVLRHNSNITTNAQVGATGGNITIDTGVIAALENSDIRADASQGSGGRVRINAQGIFGTQLRNQRTSESDITARSNLGSEFSGTVEINAPDVDPSQGLAALPAELVEASRLIATGCAAVGENEFIVTGRGGIPPSPSEPLSSDTVWTDLRPTTHSPETRLLSESATQETSSTSEQLVEAQGWVINNNGEVVLTQAPNVIPHGPWMTPATCHGASTFHK